MSLTEKQISARSQGIGASESVILFPAIPNSYCTPYELWMIKTGRMERAQEMNDFQWWGHELEPAIAKRYEHETGETLEYRAETAIHAHIPFMLCHPDRYVVGKRKLVEIKTAAFCDDERWGDAGTDQVPPEYVFQCQHQMACTDYEQVDLIVFFLAYRETRIYHIKRDNMFIASLESAIENFWHNHVLADIAPDLTALSDAKIAYPRNKFADFIEADDNVLISIESLKIIKAEIKQREAMKEDLMRHIFEFTGWYTGIKHNDKKLLTLKADARGSRRLLLADK